METEGGDATTSAAPSEPSAPPPAPTTAFTQDDVSRVASTEHAKGSREGRKALMDELGVPSVDALKALLKAQKDAELAAMSEAERLKAEAAEAKQAANAERAALVNERHSLNVERALQAAGARGDLARVSKLIDVEVGADAAAVQAAVEATKADPTFAALFGAATATPAPSEPSGGGPSSRPSTSPDAIARGLARAQLVNEGKRISSY